MKLCPKCGVREITTSNRCSLCKSTRVLDNREDHPKRWILYRARMNAKKNGIDCTLSENDIPDFPKFCPVLPWIELVYEVGKGHIGGEPSYGSVSLDRIDSTKGYIPENIRIISSRANVLKRDASDKETIALGRDAEIRQAAKGN